MKFDPGKLVMTHGVYELTVERDDFARHVQLSVARHLEGDWGDLCDDDRVANEQSLTEGGRLFSAYIQEGLQKIWIITEWDRSVTTVLLPEEY